MKKIFITIILLVVFLPNLSQAAEISLQADKNVFSAKENFLVNVFLDTSDVSVNAVEGAVIFSPQNLNLKEIREGNSLVNFWIEKPQVTQSGAVPFSGITTGGFAGKKVFLFSLIFELADTEPGVISFNDVRLLANDGKGTEITTTEKAFEFTTASQTSEKWIDKSVLDTEPPEKFLPLVASDPTVFDGAYFLVFSTVDKGVGIDHYEVREGLWGDYVETESPYLLSDQSLSKNLYVAAFDKTGNKRVIEMDAQNGVKHFQSGLILGIILIICFYLFRKKIQKLLRH
ncbi:MAG: hypothetical protein KA515_01325 [Candidatus Pacebacteria bacterium]|nr:hypothetical protein [Candidatus Paceibacterota bacterium]